MSGITPGLRLSHRSGFGSGTKSLLKISTPLRISLCWQLPRPPLSLVIQSWQEAENFAPAALDPLLAPALPYFSFGAALFRAVPIWLALAHLVDYPWLNSRYILLTTNTYLKADRQEITSSILSKREEASMAIILSTTARSRGFTSFR